MTNGEQLLTGYFLLLAMATAFFLAFDIMIFGRGFSWKKRAPVIFGFWLPTSAIMLLAIFLYRQIQRAALGWRWAPEAVGGLAWAGFLSMRHRITHRNERESAPRPPFFERLREDVRHMPRGRLVAYAVVSLWALACIIGGLLTFVIKK